MREANWPLVPLGEVLRKSNEWVSLSPDGKYKEVTVRLWGKGVAERREAYGSEIAASERLRIRTDQFVLSKIDARNGAIGLVPAHLDGAVVSSDFPAFNVDCDRALPKFIEWLSKTADFVALCKAASEGTTNRVRLKEDRFLAMKIPLPALGEQQRIVSRIEAVAGKIDSAIRLRLLSNEETDVLSMCHLQEVRRHLLTSFESKKLGALTKITSGGTPARERVVLEWKYSVDKDRRVA